MLLHILSTARYNASRVTPTGCWLWIASTAVCNVVHRSASKAGFDGAGAAMDRPTEREPRMVGKDNVSKSERLRRYGTPVNEVEKSSTCFIP